MKDRPILFSGMMVRAILALLKIMTRRTSGLKKINVEPDAWNVVANKGGGAWLFRRTDSCTLATVKCPYGVPGDRLWVRETWIPIFVKTLPGYDIDKTQYRADETNPRAGKGMWRPSIHMPRQRSRITLEITNVRVERLQDITEQDAVAEGVKPVIREKSFTVVCRGGQTFEVSSLYERGVPAVGESVSPFGEVTHVEPIPERIIRTAREAFRTLWVKINGRESWDANPWVWVVEFRMVGGGF